MKVSVVISTYTVERYDDIVRCLDSLEAQTVKPWETVLVLDPNEALVDFYVDRLKQRVLILTAPQKGLSAARNAGIANTTGDIIAFIDDDAFAEPDWLEKLLSAFDDPTVMAVGGKIEPAWDHGQPAWFPDEINWVVGCTYKGHREDRGEIRNAIGANMAFRRDAVTLIPEGFRTDIGRFGKHLLGSEEMEYCVKIRARQPQARILYEPGAIVHHHVPASRANLKYVMKRAYGEGLSKRALKSSAKGATPQLSAEGSYLKFLAKEGVLKRLMRPSGRALRQIGTLGVTVAATGWGYLRGRRAGQ